MKKVEENKKQEKKISRKKPYQKPAIVEEHTFETVALACGPTTRCPPVS